MYCTMLYGVKFYGVMFVISEPLHNCWLHLPLFSARPICFNFCSFQSLNHRSASDFSVVFPSKTICKLLFHAPASYFSFYIFPIGALFHLLCSTLANLFLYPSCKSFNLFTRFRYWRFPHGPTLDPYQNTFHIPFHQKSIPLLYDNFFLMVKYSINRKGKVNLLFFF